MVLNKTKKICLKKSQYETPTPHTSVILKIRAYVNPGAKEKLGEQEGKEEIRRKGLGEKSL